MNSTIATLEPPTLEAPVGVYADIVFDRPLDQAYTYAVPADLAATIAVGVRVQAPFGRGDKATVGYCVGVHDRPPSRAAKAVLRVLDETALLDEPLLKLTRWMADYYLCGWGQVLQAILPAGVRDQAGQRLVSFVEAVPASERPDVAAELPPKQRALLNAADEAGEALEVRDLCRRARSGPGPVAALVSKGLLRRISRRVETVDLDAPVAVPAEAMQPWVMNADQQRVFEPVREAIHAGGFVPFLLHGVTGSGKTEVYLRAIEEVTGQGREAIVLVPEISLTPQTIQRFQGRCGRVAVLHSHLSDAERGAHWRRIAAGQVKVVVGARSAVFAPCRNLGLIVIDEEHESSFKQESTPRYHARDVALMRARLLNVPVLMGSATPALESWHNAQKGQYRLLTLPSRVLDRPLPPVKIVDLRHEPVNYGKFHAIGPTLEAAMHRALKAGGQVILMLNRRGFSTHVHCPGCGFVVQCEHCDLAMTYHRHKNALVCHYCGFERGPIERCPQCDAGAVRYQGMGTEKLHAELAEKFPQYVTQRMDSDTMHKPGSHEKALDAFRDGQSHILLGTQMIAKGLDFPNVTLVGVVNADVGLHLPDFRASERTFQLLAQVAGRAGRGERGGLVLVQSFTPEHPCIVLAAQHDYKSFVEGELATRTLHDYPPFQRLARLVIRSLDAEQAVTFADRLAGAFREAQRDKQVVRVLGPAECPVHRLNGYFRFHFQLQCLSSATLHKLLRNVLASVRPPASVEFQVDVDPHSMM